MAVAHAVDQLGRRCRRQRPKGIASRRFDEIGIRLSARPRKGVRETQVQPDVELQAGDVLVLTGTPEALAKAEIRLLQG